MSPRYQKPRLRKAVAAIMNIQKKLGAKSIIEGSLKSSKIFSSYPFS